MSEPRDIRPRTVVFDVPTPPASDRWVPILTPWPSRPVKALILSTRAVGVLVHWEKSPAMVGSGRTVPHTVPDDMCPLCVELNQRPRWHGYLAAWIRDPGRYAILDITVHAVHTCPSLNPTSAINLRGRELLLKRTGKAANSPVSAELSDPVKLTAELPLSFDVTQSLMRLWGYKSTSLWQLAAEVPVV